jgi:hypothetical protein
MVLRIAFLAIPFFSKTSALPPGVSHSPVTRPPTSVPGACPDPVGGVRCFPQLLRFRVFSNLRTLLRSFAVFSEIALFVFKGLQTLLQNTGGGGGVSSFTPSEAEGPLQLPAWESIQCLI